MNLRLIALGMAVAWLLPSCAEEVYFFQNDLIRMLEFWKKLCFMTSTRVTTQWVPMSEMLLATSYGVSPVLTLQRS